MKRGFTLVELMISVAIIGILSAIVVSSVSSSRNAARDTERISDLREIQLALALYYDVNREYPTALSKLAESDQKYLSAVPADPNGAQYEYSATNRTYCLGAVLDGVPPADSANCATGGSANYKVSR